MSCPAPNSLAPLSVVATARAEQRLPHHTVGTHTPHELQPMSTLRPNSLAPSRGGNSTYRAAAAAPHTVYANINELITNLHEPQLSCAPVRGGNRRYRAAADTPHPLHACPASTRQVGQSPLYSWCVVGVQATAARQVGCQVGCRVGRPMLVKWDSRSSTIYGLLVPPLGTGREWSYLVQPS